MHRLVAGWLRPIDLLITTLEAGSRSRTLLELLACRPQCHSACSRCYLQGQWRNTSSTNTGDSSAQAGQSTNDSSHGDSGGGKASIAMIENSITKIATAAPRPVVRTNV
jgi:hypothetical protein